MNLTQIDTAAVIIIDDGQFRFPVHMGRFEAFEEANGKLTHRNYEAFCDSVPVLTDGNPAPLVGSQEMIDNCEQLIEAGASLVRVDHSR